MRYDGNMLDLVIIGGGIHGTYLSHALSSRIGVSNLAVIDPFTQPFTLWRRQTRACGMQYLRSPGGHNLDLSFRALRDYAFRDGWDPRTSFIPPYDRPMLDLFNAHAESVVSDNGLARFRMPGRVDDIRLLEHHVEVRLGEQTVRARRAVLSVGRGASLCVPDWAGTVDPLGRVALHLFDPRFDREQFADAASPTIIGAGASGVQLALYAAERADRPITIISEQPLQVRRFDSDPCFIGPRCAAQFLQQRDYSQRRAMITAARAPGSIPEDVAARLAELQALGMIRVVVGAVTHARTTNTTAPSVDGSPVQLVLTLRSGEEIRADRVALATGFAPAVPAGALVDRLARRYRLRRAPDGFPVPDSYLRWHDRLFLSGALAELELGPFAPNIIGAIAAAKRLGAFFLQSGKPAELHGRPLSRVWRRQPAQTGSSSASRD